MANKRTTGTRSAVIRCPNCGEDYSVTYKYCPFCDEKTEHAKRQSERPSDGSEEETHAGRGGRRLAETVTRSWTPLRIAGTVIPLAIIAAALWIVLTQVVPLVNRGALEGGGQAEPDGTAPITNTQAVDESPMPTDSVPPVETQPAPTDTQTPESSQIPESTVPAGQTATSFTLSQSDFTINDSYPNPVRLAVTFQPHGTVGTITWSSSDPDIASVDSSGLVSHGTKNGTATITATMGDGTTQTCTVRCSFSGNSSSSSSNNSSSSGTLSLNRSDFTLMSAGEKFQMKVSGTSSNPTWHIGNTNVATISGDGTVTAVGEGNTTITCTVDGQTLECIVRCDF